MNVSLYESRRARVFQAIGAGSAAVLFSAPLQHRNGDSHFPFRQNSDFFYLTGCTEPESIAVLLSYGNDGEFIFFNRESSPQEIRWNGRMLGQPGAITELGAHQAFKLEEFPQQFKQILQNIEQLYVSFSASKSHLNEVIALTQEVKNTQKRKKSYPQMLSDLDKIVHEMRLFKDEHEISQMKKACEISANAHIEAMKAARPHMKENELHALLMYHFLKEGCNAEAYPSIVGAGENACILHYIENNAVIQKDDLVLIDAGGEYGCYSADITRTFPASGKFEGPKRALYEIVLEAQKAGIAAAMPGLPFDGIQKAILKVLVQGLIDVGILQGDRDSLIEREAYRPFYMHNSGHWLGLDVHDVGNYWLNDHSRLLEPNMVLTVEPGLYLGRDESGVPEEFAGIGIRIEDDILIARDKPIVLSENAPKEIDSIESCMVV